ncbi:MAG: hypothetical protein NZ825_14210 [Candidatus Marinimicrobia bacterium]|nr:hypothetical protein [Candidatus Neomarinimicrobiota bacterium]
MKAIILYISFISFTFGISLKDVGTLIKSITLYGNINTSNVVTDIYIGAVTESIYSYSYGIETQLSSLGLKGRYNKIYLSLGFSQGGFFQRNIHETIDYEVQKRYQIHYAHSALIYPLPLPKGKFGASSGLYFGLPISGKIVPVRGGFNQPEIELKKSYLKTDIGLLLMIKYNLNSSLSLRSTLKYGLNNSFDYTYEGYKASNRIIGIGISYRYNDKKKRNIR